MTITIENRIARVMGSPQIVCGNSDDTVTFAFDAEWDAYDAKNARFQYLRDGALQHEDVDFNGNICAVPLLTDVDFVEIGVSAGEIRTTTPARVPCIRCITDIPAEDYEAPQDIYNELLDALQEALHPLPKLPAGYVFITTSDGSYVTASDGSFIIAKE